MTIAIMVAVALQAPTPALPALLTGLEGEWVCRVNRSSRFQLWRRESWHTDAAGRLVGRIRLEQATAGRPHLVEQSTVGIVGNRLFYQTRDSLISYRLLRSEGDEVIFESAGRARPRRIAFRRDGRFLRVMHINRDGRSESWTYQRSGARSAAPYCSGSYRR